jgi:hypothetical protein
VSVFLRGKSYYYEFRVRGTRYVKALGPLTKTQAKREEATARAKAWAGTLEVKPPSASAIVPSEKISGGREYL